MNLTLTLPYPPSTNRLWRMFRGHMVLSDEARAFKAEAAMTARLKCDTPTARLVAVRLTFFRPRLSRDVDNSIKIVLDSLNGVVYDDDRQVDEMHIYRRLDREHPRVEVEVCELA